MEEFNREPATKVLSNQSDSKVLYIVIGVLVFMIVCLSVAVGYLVLKESDVVQNEKDSAKIAEDEDTDSTDVSVDESIEDDTDTEDVTDTDSDDEVSDNDSEDTSVDVDPYEGWDEYSDDEFCFSFKYPSSWSVNADYGRYDDNGDPISPKYIEVMNLHDKTVVSIMIYTYYGAIGSGEEVNYDNVEILTIEGKTFYSYDCADSSQTYFDEVLNSQEFRTQGTCFQLHDRNLEQEGIDPIIDILYFQGKSMSSVRYGSAGRFEDFVPSLEDKETAVLVIESLENFL